MKKIEDFLEQYGGLELTKVKFRPGVVFTTGFGIDNTFEVLRIHNAIDRGNLGDVPEKNPIYCPFDANIEWHEEYGGGFGSLMRIIVEDYGFEVRVMHMNWKVVELSEGTKGSAKAGALLGYAGNKGVGTGRHTHVEVVSLGETSEVINALMELKKTDKTEITLTDAEAYKKANRSSGPADVQFVAEMQKRNIFHLYKHHCIRRDYFDSKMKTFYSSLAAFGM